MEEGRHLSILIWITGSNNQTTTDRRGTLAYQNRGEGTLISSYCTNHCNSPSECNANSHCLVTSSTGNFSCSPSHQTSDYHRNISVDWCRSLLEHCQGSHHTRKWSHSNELKNQIPTLRTTITTTDLYIEHAKCYYSIHRHRQW